MLYTVKWVASCGTPKESFSLLCGVARFCLKTTPLELPQLCTYFNIYVHSGTYILI